MTLFTYLEVRIRGQANRRLTKKTSVDAHISVKYTVIELYTT